jgi:phosphoserine phosphatase
MSSPLGRFFAPEVAAAIDHGLPEGGVWVTDADGTLWSSDIGEEFLRELIRDHVLIAPEAHGIDVWAEYCRRVKVDKASGFAWAVQVMAGLEEDEVVRRAGTCARAFVKEHLFPEMAEVIALAQKRNVATWIVSASNPWIVAAAAPLLGIESAHVLGMAVAVRDGRLTTDVVLPLTYARGKAELVRRHVGRMPTLVSGDSRGDLEMMLLSTRSALVLRRPGGVDPGLAAECGRAGWAVHDPRKPGLDRDQQA